VKGVVLCRHHNAFGIRRLQQAKSLIFPLEMSVKIYKIEHHAGDPKRFDHIQPMAEGETQRSSAGMV
jgi:hypothetical protein